VAVVDAIALSGSAGESCASIPEEGERMRVRTTVLLLVGALLCSTAYAQVPPRINYQGVLTNSSGTPINATVSMVLKLYNVSSGGTALYSETQTVTVTNGVFNLLIGSVTPLTLPFDVQYYLGITVGTDPEMAPRQPLASVPYAIRSGTGGGVPVGTVIAYAGPTFTVPSGWLVCDGSSVSRTQWGALFAAVQTSWGSGDGSTTFNLPDLSGRFLRGVDKDGGGTPTAAPRDADRDARTVSNAGGNSGNNVGSLQVDELASHTHAAAGNTKFVLTHVSNNGLSGIQILGGGGSTFDISTTTAGSGGNESRPKNASVIWIIKAQ
jgi:microcystin-dependent protein